MSGLPEEIKEKLREGMGKKLDEKELAQRRKRMQAILFNFRQRYLTEARNEFIQYGTIMRVDTDFELDGRKIELAYRYDPLNDSLVPIQ